MRGRHRVVALGAAGVLAALLGAAASEAAETTPGNPGVTARVYLGDKVLVRSVREAVEGAAQRLARPECSRVFADFNDASGRRLDEKLEALGQTGRDYLGVVLFEDGHARRRCGDRGVMAVTAPGSRVVYCREFARQQRSRPDRAEAILIHEALHSLGLGESPATPGAPTSAQITEKVLARCGG